MTTANRSSKKASTLQTTVGELAAAFYDAALSELKNPVLAARVAQRMVRDAINNNRVALATR